MKRLNHIKRFNESTGMDVEIIGTGPKTAFPKGDFGKAVIDDILGAIDFINNNYDVRINPTDFQEDSDKPYVHHRNGNYSIFAKLDASGDEKSHIGFINDLLDKNGFLCRLYI